MEERNAHLAAIPYPDNLCSATQPLRMERDESGQVVMRRAPDNKLHSDLLRFNSTVDELTVEIVVILSDLFRFANVGSL